MIASFNRLTASCMVFPESCAPAVVKWPPPPSFSMISCTLMRPKERAEMLMESSNGKRTNEPATPEMFIRSSAACAAMARSIDLSETLTAYIPSINSAFLTSSARAM